jgi:hypothetical protein
VLLYLGLRPSQRFFIHKLDIVAFLVSSARLERNVPIYVDAFMNERFALTVSMMK